ncbi:hypothetical protein DM01DRAFT_1294621 [Hesseltinella vesiculosa]|uniref:RlpA-like protein double-psi beta-barrel domain-containing protein n=1 Tax=Hesseltinella vesiculosa TaxID=101127 RepID=A0A1X2G5C6_9FUNG|nr:hypothetical protein DM01DRAFT_1294621 [Hesseltinella vesiculosa]
MTTTSSTTTKTSSSSAAATSTTSSSSSSGTFSGRITWYQPSGTGSCGTTISNTMIVALNQQQMNNGANSNKNPLCGKQVNIQYKGKSVTATIVDTCPDCPQGALDVSPLVFQSLASLGVGVLQDVSWSFV